MAWKWVIISLHGALYGFAICALKGTNSYRVMKSGKESSIEIKVIPKGIENTNLPPNFKISDNGSKKRLKFKGIMTMGEANQLLKLSDDESYQEAVEKLYDQTHELISFWEAIERCQEPQWMSMTVQSRVLNLSNSKRDSIKTLHDALRNNFEHYRPKHWEIEIDVMSQITMDVLEVIRFLALDTGNYVPLNESQKKRVRSIIFQCKRLYKQNRKSKGVRP